MDACLDYLRENGAEPALVIDPHTVVTAPWTTFKCQFGCENFGKNHCCPPEAPDYTRTRAVLDSFSTGILFRVHHWNATAMAAEGARRLFLDGYYKALAFGSGPCKLCPSCAPEGCRFPGKAVPAMEACGIDVFATARAHGLEVRTLRVLGEERNHFGAIPTSRDQQS